MDLTRSRPLHPPSLERIDAVDIAPLPLNHLPFTVGRAHDCSLSFAELYVSRQHAQITAQGTQLLLTDARSRHGTFVNSRRIDTHLLASADILQFGSLSAPRLRFVGPPVHPAATDLLLTQLRGLSTSRSDLEKLRWFVLAARYLSDAGRLPRVFASLLAATLALTGVERGYLFLARAPGRLSLELGMDADGNTLDDGSTVSHAILDRASAGADPFLVTGIPGAGTDDPQSTLTDSTRTVICIPLRDPRPHPDGTSPHPLLGILYLDSSSHPGSLTAIDHELLRTIALEAAALVEDIRLSGVQPQAHPDHQEQEIATRTP